MLSKLDDLSARVDNNPRPQSAAPNALVQGLNMPSLFSVSRRLSNELPPQVVPTAEHPVMKEIIDLLKANCGAEYVNIKGIAGSLRQSRINLFQTSLFNANCFIFNFVCTQN